MFTAMDKPGNTIDLGAGNVLMAPMQAVEGAIKERGRQLLHGNARSVLVFVSLRIAVASGLLYLAKKGLKRWARRNERAKKIVDFFADGVFPTSAFGPLLGIGLVALHMGSSSRKNKNTPKVPVAIAPVAENIADNVATAVETTNAVVAKVPESVVSAVESTAAAVSTAPALVAEALQVANIPTDKDIVKS